MQVPKWDEAPLAGSSHRLRMTLATEASLSNAMEHTYFARAPRAGSLWWYWTYCQYHLFLRRLTVPDHAHTGARLPSNHKVRMTQPVLSPAVIRFEVFEVDLKGGELRKGGRKVKLQEQPFRVLALLLERPGEVVAREELRQALWPADTFVDFDHGLNSAVARLREALNDSASQPRFIETIPRQGYRFIALLDLPAPPPPSSHNARSETASSSACLTLLGGR